MDLCELSRAITVSLLVICYRIWKLRMAPFETAARYDIVIHPGRKRTLTATLNHLRRIRFQKQNQARPSQYKQSSESDRSWLAADSVRFHFVYQTVTDAVSVF